VGALLASFDKNKEWVDITTWLQKLEKALKEFPSPHIKEKVQLSKRLAQCMNPMLPPPIHLATIGIYNQIFTNMKYVAGGYNSEYNQLLCDDLGFYSLGLFPFYKSGSIKTKQLFLKVIRNNFIPLGKELVPALPGLALGLLPNLEESNQELLADLEQTLNMIGEVVGVRQFIGAI